MTRWINTFPRGELEYQGKETGKEHRRTIRGKEKAESVNLKIEVKTLKREMRRKGLPSVQWLRLRLPMQGVWV